MAGVPDDHAEESVASWSGLKTILSILEETMKINLVAALAGSAISFALATSAQQKDTVDPKVEQQIRALAQKYDEAINSHDAATAASLFTQDGIGQIPESKVSPGHGRQGMEKAFARWFKFWQVHNYFTTVDRVTAVGNEIRSFGKWSDSFKGIEGSTINFEGHYSWVLVREGDTWKIRRSTCSGYFTG
jgi:ketosteroid isomerase-like protein